MNKDVWKYVLIGVALIAIVVSAISTFGGRGTPKPPDWLLYVDVSTGDVYELRMGGRGRAIPAKNVETGERTLFPAEQLASGDIAVHSHYVGDFFRELASDEHVDLETGRVLRDGVEPVRKPDW